jgi:hypothetical protein
MLRTHSSVTDMMWQTSAYCCSCTIYPLQWQHLLAFQAFFMVMALFMLVLACPLLNTGEILCGKSLFHCRRKKLLGPVGGKIGFCPLPCAAANSVTICHSLSFVHIAHLSLVVFNYSWLQSVCIVVITFCWLIVHITQHLHISFALPNQCCEFSPCCQLNVTLF